MLKEPPLIAHLIQSYAKSKNLSRGKQIHGYLITTNFMSNTIISNHIITMYSKCGDTNAARNMFDVMLEKNLIAWTALISGLSQNNKHHEAIKTFSLMHIKGMRPNQFAFSSSIQCVSYLRELGMGKELHCLSLKLNFNADLFVGSNLANMYLKCGYVNDASRVFEELFCKDEVTWATMIDGYAKNGYFEKAVLTFKLLLKDDIFIVDQHVFCSVFYACGGMKDCKTGKCIHAITMKMGFSIAEVAVNALVDMYSKGGDMESGLNVINHDTMSWNVVRCSSMINGFVEMEKFDNAFALFVECKRRGVEPDEYTYSSLIKACACQAIQEQGSQLHGQVIKTGYAFDPFVSAVLVDMYGKCGFVDLSMQIFGEISNPNDFAWSSMIGVLAQHGQGKEATRVFGQMLMEDVSPNHVTFINLLLACSHSGLVDEGLKYFDLMQEVYGIEPRDEHYACVIDMLGRAGKLKEVEEFIGKMKVELNAFGWCSLLRACRTHGNKKLGEVAAEKLIELEPDNSGLHVLLSNIYASENQWEDFKVMRKLMRDKGVKKLPGFSWVDVNNKTHVFAAEDRSHIEMVEIYNKLEELSGKIREEGYVPDTKFVASNVEESAKERLLQYHSERIAVAFALIRMPKSKPIVVKKNLRICVDCHSAFKLIAKVESREIIVRDNARFHHFSNGLCSCRDYW